MIKQLSVILLVLGFWMSSRIQAQPTQHSSSDGRPDHLSHSYEVSGHPDDRFWDDRFTVGGPAGWVASMAVDSEGHLVVGGAFNTAGDQIMDLVARWDGVSWRSLGSGVMSEDLLCETCRWVKVLAVGGSGTLYAGGRKLLDDHTFAARLDGDSWSRIGTGNWLGEMDAMAVDDHENLYAGGYFYGLREQANEYVLKWDGNDWAPLGDGVNGAVTALALDGMGGLFVGGSFDSTAGMSARRIARWDGTSWSPLGDGIDGWVQAIALDREGHLIVGGNFEKAGSVTAHNIARWDGTSWSPLGEGVDGGVNGIVVDEDGSLVVGGSFKTAGGITARNIARWDGQSWSSLGTGLESRVSSLAIDEHGDLYAAGEFHSVGGELAFRVAKWDGIRWSPLTAGTGQGVNSSVNAFAVDERGDLYAGGSFTIAGDIFANVVAKWNGDSWSSLGSGLVGWVVSLTIDGNGNLFAGGRTSAGNVAMWDGESWSSVGDGPNGMVHALVLGNDGNLYAGGQFDSVGSVPANNVAMWDGASWSPLGDGLEGSWFTSVDALAVDRDGNLFVGGSFDTAGGESAENIARWDGAAWSAVGGGVDPDGVVRTLAFDAHGKLFAAGNFSTAGGTKVYNIAVWDGTSWNPLGIGFNTTVLALTVDETGGLYAAGQFTALGPSANQAGFSHIARWDGTEWFQLGSGTEKEIKALALDGRGFLYAGGRFSLAGNKPSVGIARWDAASAMASSISKGESPVAAITMSAYPNPFSTHATLEIAVDKPQRLVVSLFDVSGRQVRELFDGFSTTPQIHRIEVDGANFSSGTYFVRIRGESFIRIQAVALVK